MAITDELRRYVKDHTNWDVALTTYPPQRTMTYHEGAMDAIADRIDAEHDEVRDFCERLERAATNREDVTLWGVDYAALPLDADGEPIHIGDVMEFSRFEIDCPVTREVDGIGQGVFFAWCGERGYEQLNADSYRRHHAPTVEDVLREFALACEDAGNAGPEVARIAAEYAAKLRLAGEGE